MLAFGRLLLKHGADVSAKTNKGWAVFHILIQNLHRNNQDVTLAFIRLLLDHHVAGGGCTGDLLSAKTCEGWTVLHLLASNPHLYSQDANGNTIRALLSLILEQPGIDYNAQTKDGHTTLHLLCKKLLFRFVFLPGWAPYATWVWDFRKAYIYPRVFLRAMLEEHGANPTIQDNRGKIPLEYLGNRMRLDRAVVFLIVRSMVERRWSDPTSIFLFLRSTIESGFSSRSSIVALRGMMMMMNQRSG